MRGSIRTLVFALLLAAGWGWVTAPPAAAQGPQPSTSPLPSPRAGDFERRRAIALKAFNPRTLIKDAYDPPRWFKDGERFLRWSASGPHEGTFTIVNARTRTDRPVVSSADLKAQLGGTLGQEVPIPPALNYLLTPDERRVVFMVAGRPYSLDLANGRVSATAPADPAAVALAGGLLSPDGRLVAVAQGGSFILSASQGPVVEMKPEPDGTWQLAENAWSPDGRFLLVARTDNSGVHKIPIVDYSDPLEDVTMVPHAKVGTPLPKFQYHLVDVSTGSTAAIPGLGEEGYYFHVGWRAEASEALLLYLSRDGKRLELKAIDAANGETRPVLREENAATFVADLNFFAGGAAAQVTPLPHDRGFLWLSERDGWRNFYLYDYSGKLQRQLSFGNSVVHRVLHVGKKDLFFLASVDGEAPYDRHVFRVNLRGGRAVRVTRDAGYHQPTFSPSGLYFADSHSSPRRPRVSEVVSVKGGEIYRYAQADISGLLEIGYQPPELFKATSADGVTPIFGAIIKPYDFDSAKRYPVVNYIYNGPFTANVPAGYIGCGCAITSAETRANALAQMGFIVVIVDPRGSPGRSKAFHDASYGKLGQIEVPDVVAAIRQAAATRPYMDLKRVGVVGHSWGGYYALRGMLTAPDFFKAGYAGAPGALTESAQINEPNLGLRSINPTAYQLGSNEALAGNLKGALKIMHGTSDSSAPLSTTMRMADALIRAGKHFDLLLMPGQPHNPPQPWSTYYLDDQLMFLIDHLGGPE